REDLAAHLVEERTQGILHVLHLAVLVVAPFPVEPERRDAPAVLHLGIDLAEAPLVGDHLAAAREPDGGAVEAAVGILERLAIAAELRIGLDPAHEPVRRHAPPAPDLDVVAAGEIELAVVEPPGTVQVPAADAVLVV